MQSKVWLMTLAAAVLSAGLTPGSEVEQRLAEKVRREIVTLPFYGVFDAISFEVSGDTVKLAGAVTRPTLKSDIGNIVAKLEGVRKVENNIEVLPLSPYDDRIRLAVLRAVYGYPALQRYGAPPNPPIRIIVENGRVSLQGVVDNEADRNIAFMRANAVAGVFEVENRLLVAGKKG